MDGHSDISVGPDINKVRRFSIGVGLVLTIYVFAGGEINPDIHSSIVNIKIARPEAILLFLILSSVYSAWHYWYFGVAVPPTRAKIRTYLKNPMSILVVKYLESNYKVNLLRSDSHELLAHAQMEERCPAGRTPFDFIIYTDAMAAPNDGYMRRLVANRVDQFFPGITPGEITLSDSPAGDANMQWATVGRLSRGTEWREFLEDLDLFAPILLNTFSFFLITTLILYCYTFFCPAGAKLL